MSKIRNYINIVENISKQNINPNIQFHLSVEPNLLLMTDFAHQSRTISSAGSRGEAGGEGIYTTNNWRYWASQLAYENIDSYPRYVYLVYVKDGSNGSVWAAHQDCNDPKNVIVLAKLGDIGLPDSDDTDTDYNKIDWLASKWIKSNSDILQRIE